MISQFLGTPAPTPLTPPPGPYGVESTTTTTSTSAPPVTSSGGSTPPTTATAVTTTTIETDFDPTPC